MNINQLKTSSSRFLAQGDVLKPILVTIAAVGREDIQFDGETESKAVVKFEEDVKEMVANNTNLDILARIFESRESEDWVGGKVVVFVDENVMFGPKRVGGLRFRAPKGAKKQEEESEVGY